MSLVWYYPARGLCSSGYTLMFENHIQGAYYHGNGGCQTVNMVLCSENQDQRAKRTVAMQILGATVNRAVQILGDLNFASVPILKVIRRTERRWNSSISNSTERRFVVLARRVGPGLMAESRDLLISMPSSGFSPGQGRNTTVVVGIWKCFLSSQTRVVRRQLGLVDHILERAQYRHWLSHR